MSQLRGLTRDLVNSLFTYADGELYWKGHYLAGPRVGDKVYRTNPDGYLFAEFGGFRYPVHQIIWTMFKGTIPEGFTVDHIDRVRTNNRIENYRLITSSGNRVNSGPRTTNTSKYKGVHYSKGKWAAQISFPGDPKRYWLGSFNTEAEAALEYNEAAKEFFGKLAVLNEVPNA